MLFRLIRTIRVRNSNTHTAKHNKLSKLTKHKELLQQSKSITIRNSQQNIIT